jgi:hypothetical protein
MSAFHAGLAPGVPPGGQSVSEMKTVLGPDLGRQTVSCAQPQRD